MKLFLSLLFLIAAPATFAAQQQVETNKNITTKTIFLTVKTTLDFLSDQWKYGKNHLALLSLQSFYKSINNPEYQAEGNARDILKALDLLDADNKIPQFIREAVQQHDKTEINNFLYIQTAVMPVENFNFRINLLFEKITRGSIPHAHALSEFYKAIKDTDYSIQDATSKEILKTLALVDDEGKIPEPIRLVCKF